MVSSKRTSARSVSTLIAPLILRRCRPISLDERLLNFGCRVPARLQLGFLIAVPQPVQERGHPARGEAHAQTLLDESGDGRHRGIERVLQVSVELPQLLGIKQRFAAQEAHAQQLPNAAFRVALVVAPDSIRIDPQGVGHVRRRASLTKQE